MDQAGSKRLRPLRILRSAEWGRKEIAIAETEMPG